METVTEMNNDLNIRKGRKRSALKNLATKALRGIGIDMHRLELDRNTPVSTLIFYNSENRTIRVREY